MCLDKILVLMLKCCLSKNVGKDEYIFVFLCFFLVYFFGIFFVYYFWGVGSVIGMNNFLKIFV